MLQIYHNAISCVLVNTFHSSSVGFRASLYFFWNHSYVDLGSLSCCKVKCFFIFTWLTEDYRFCAKISMIAFTLTTAPVSAEKTQAHSMMLPPPCFSMDIVLSCFCTKLSELCPQSSTWVSSCYNTLCHTFAVAKRKWLVIARYYYSSCIFAIGFLAPSLISFHLVLLSVL